jgi:hypothetical protein
MIILAIAVAITLLAIPPAAAQQGQPQRHYQKGDVWVGCVANAPATSWNSAFFEALSIGNKEHRSCWINQQRGWWLFHWTRRVPVVTVKKMSFAERAGSFVGSFFYPSAAIGCTIRKRFIFLS